MVTMGMMPAAVCEIYDANGRVIGTASELTPDDDYYWFCRQVNIPRLCC